MPKLRNGHAPGHVRDTALAAFEAWLHWNGDGPEPTVEYEVHYEPHQIPISRACGLGWNFSHFGAFIVDATIAASESAISSLASWRPDTPFSASDRQSNLRL